MLKTASGSLGLPSSHPSPPRQPLGEGSDPGPRATYPNDWAGGRPVAFGLRACVSLIIGAPKSERPLSYLLFVLRPKAVVNKE